MPAPSPLAIATGSVQRLVKEEASYHKELAEQEKQIAVLEEQIKAGKDDEDGNASFMLKQQVCNLFCFLLELSQQSPLCVLDRLLTCA